MPIKDKEIEIQVQVEKSRKLIEFLKKKAKFLGEKHQVDKYYSPKHRKFVSVRPVREWLRLRDSSGKFSINYKNWHYDRKGKSNYCDEYESPVESFEQLEKIFKVLNMKLEVIVNKTRKIWVFKNYEIAVDNIKGLGDFVEIEYKGLKTSKSPKIITQEMVEWLRQFNPGKISRNYVGYPFQLMFPKEVEYEEV